MPGFVRRAAAEPLTHFLLIGAVLFAGLSAAHALRRPTVQLDAAELNQLTEYWALQMQRPPTKAELAAIIHDRIDEELLAREAERLGLGKGDMIVRRRLAQKMSFAADDLTAANPAEAELRAYFARTADRYAGPTQVSFQQAFFSADRPGGAAEPAAQAALGRARDGNRDPSGDPFVFPAAYENIGAQDLLRDYGPAFVKALETAPVGTWTGPVATPYGWHLIRVSARRQSPAVTYESVAPQVREAWMAERREKAHAQFLASLRKRYRVLIAGVPES